jgi:NAD(P)-dependent dehydrogenase (short-subunit alcohol dehydrogenase family)
MSNLNGKIALVTGAGGRKGVGRATALKLASLGADVAITDVPRPDDDLPPLERGDQWNGIESVAAEIHDMIEKVVGKFGRIDILVNNARAIIGKDRVPIWELDADIWQHFLDINTTAVFLATKFAAKHMIDQGGGRIINIASVASKRGSPKSSAYCASKFAVLGLTQCAALDLAPHKITVNSVCPGGINTDRMNYAEQAEANARGVPLETYRAQVVERMNQGTPLGRVAESEDVAHLVAFLASDEAEMITGQGYNINGGTLFH